MKPRPTTAPITKNPEGTRAGRVTRRGHARSRARLSYVDLWTIAGIRWERIALPASTRSVPQAEADEVVAVFLATGALPVDATPPRV